MPKRHKRDEGEDAKCPAIQSPIPSPAQSPSASEGDQLPIGETSETFANHSSDATMTATLETAGRFNVTMSVESEPLMLSMIEAAWRRGAQYEGDWPATPPDNLAEIVAADVLGASQAAQDRSA